MIKKFMLFFIVIFGFSSLIYSDSISCEFKSSCDTGEAAFFYASDKFHQPQHPLRILSSNLRANFNSNYNMPLCCGSPYGDINSQILLKDVHCDGIDLMYFTNDTNARVGFNNIDSSVYTDFIESHFTYKSCVYIPDDFSSFDIIISDRNYAVNGYSCMYRASALENGMISSCDATFNNGQSYNFIVWGRMWESLSSLTCNVDCTSKLDGRIRSACSQQVSSCTGVPIVCDGALVGSWVKYDDSKEVQCSDPWNKFRSNVFTDVSIEVETVGGKCSNLISKKYTVIVDNEQVIMNVFICND